MWVATEAGSTLLPEIAKLKKEQAKMREDRKRLAKELKNAEKRRSRLKKRAKQLSGNDLVAVMLLRAAEKGESTTEHGCDAGASSTVADAAVGTPRDADGVGCDA